MVESPPATPIMLPSAIPESKNLSGYAFLNIAVFVASCGRDPYTELSVFKEKAVTLVCIV